MTILKPRFRVVYGEIRHVVGFNFLEDTEFFYHSLRKRPASSESYELKKLIETSLLQAKTLAESAARYAIFPVNKTLETWFPDASAVGLGIVTIGPELEEEAVRLGQAGNLVESLLLDAWGSALVEGAVNTIDVTMRQEGVILGFTGGKRRSPGFKPWQLSDQQEVFRLLGGNSLNVHLNDSFLMNPRKSVSFGIQFS